ncbi:hypothetical protein Atai01_66270 [Amycolatopsis taiwanensis]|uniref:Uncharacterized protein n=1 Tax=Amycolatopsis taiwanensis TaxID=342230 RepID=A0A9W6R680_9PSEU|nr:hypothetical protein Atai01_66270 [Amycolatopsis taiwanensis]
MSPAGEGEFWVQVCEFWVREGEFWVRGGEFWVREGKNAKISPNPPQPTSTQAPVVPTSTERETLVHTLVDQLQIVT